MAGELQKNENVSTFLLNSLLSGEQQEAGEPSTPWRVGGGQKAAAATTKDRHLHLQMDIFKTFQVSKGDKSWGLRILNDGAGSRAVCDGAGTFPGLRWTVGSPGAGLPGLARPLRRAPRRRGRQVVSQNTRRHYRVSFVSSGKAGVRCQKWWRLVRSGALGPKIVRSKMMRSKIVRAQGSGV